MFIDENTMQPIKNVFEIDDEIYPVLAVLWDKGYVTKYCCAGHNEVARCELSCKTQKQIEKMLEFPNIQIYICMENNVNIRENPEGFSIFEKELYDLNNGQFIKKLTLWLNV